VTYADALARGRAELEAGGIDNAALEARNLLARAAGIELSTLISRSGEEAPRLALKAYDDHLLRRQRGEPVARIFREAEFYGLTLGLNASTLVPRADTETLVDIVLAEARSRFSPNLRICDLGTGCGAIAIALLAELRNAHAVATDISEGALAMAKANAAWHGVNPRLTLRHADFATALEGKFDIVVSNPPYIRSALIATLQREVRDHEPLIALDGGEDGLAAHRAILSQVGTLLGPGGFLALEIGYDQGEAVAALFRAAGLSRVRVHPDLAGRTRVVSGFESLAVTKKSGVKKALGKVERSG
jgi:release factor glutamine methyltransferase